MALFQIKVPVTLDRIYQIEAASADEAKEQAFYSALGSIDSNVTEDWEDAEISGINQKRSIPEDIQYHGYLVLNDLNQVVGQDLRGTRAKAQQWAEKVIEERNLEKGYICGVDLLSSYKVEKTISFQDL